MAESASVTFYQNYPKCALALASVGDEGLTHRVLARDRLVVVPVGGFSDLDPAAAEIG